MKIVVVGATGHIGSYLVPLLVEGGHEVVALSRGQQSPYRQDPAWSRVQQVQVDRDEEDRAGTFAGRVAELGADVVVDLICFTTESAEQLVDALRGRPTFLVHCGTIWVHGPATEVPVAEEQARDAFGEYGTSKAAIEELLREESRSGGLRSTVLHPGHISGPGWEIINPAGNLDPDVWRRLATGQPVQLPNFGLETLHHVHAADVATAFRLAVEQPEQAEHESFHVVSEAALTLRGYATAAARWFGQEADIELVAWPDFRAAVADEHAQATWEHISRSPTMSIEKARSRLGYRPAYTSLETAEEAVRWLVRQGRIGVGQDRLVDPRPR